VAQMNEFAADGLSPAQAADLLHILDLRAEWENTRGEPAKGSPVPSATDLRTLQNTFEAYRIALADYSKRYKSEAVPDIAGSIAERVATWCRTVRAVLRRAEGHAGAACPAQVMAKVYRLADRIAERAQKDRVARGPAAGSLWAAIQEMDSVIRWCDGVSAPQPA
jgi:hypothetical protein